MKISIVAPAYNNIENVRRLLRSICERFDDSMGEVVVVDDCSKLCDMAVLKNEFRGLRVIRLESNGGAAAARNAGAKNALNDVIFFLDSDMVLCDNTINEVFASMSDNAVAAVVGTPCDIPLNRGVFQDYWALLKAYFHSLPKEFSTTFYPMVGAIRKDVFEDTGRFDDKIKGASVEDYEFSNRLNQKGYKVKFNPRIMVKTAYKDFFTSISQSTDRARKWGILFLDRKKFDNHTTTFGQGLANLLGFAILLTLVFSLFNINFLFAAAVFLVLFLFVNRGFFSYVFKRRGVAFLLVSVVLYLVSSLFITYGFLSGIACVFIGRKLRQELLYG